MAMALMDIYRLRADYLEWSGGKPPRFDEEINSFMEDAYGRDEDRDELKRWRDYGLSELPANVKVCTYHGNAQPDAVESGKAEEYGAPYVPVAIENADGLAVYCGGKDRKQNNPGIVIERQSDRWAFFIGNNAFGDHDIIVYAMDDGRMVVVEDAIYRPDYLTFDEDIPDPLPPEQWKYTDKEETC